jgi:hypothetical protein
MCLRSVGAGLVALDNVQLGTTLVRLELPLVVGLLKRSAMFLFRQGSAPLESPLLQIDRRRSAVLR